MRKQSAFKTMLENIERRPVKANHVGVTYLTGLS